MSQTNPLATDSLKTAKTKQADSLVRQKKVDATSKVDSAYSHSISEFGQTRSAIQNKINSNTDSSAKAGYRNQFNTRASAFTSDLKSLPKRSYQAIKKELPKGNDLLRFSMNIRSENYATTAQNPMIKSELMYSRLYLSPTFTFLGLPFTSNLFFTTEANNTYKNNFFSFRLDVNAMKQLAQQRMRKEIDEAQKLDRLRQIDLNKNALETQKYQNEIDQLKNQLPDYQALDKTISDQVQSRSKQYLEKEKAILEEKLKNASDKEKARLQSEYEHRADSMKNAIRTQVNDSINSGKAARGEKLDTAKLNRLIRLEAQLYRLQSKKNELERLRQMDTVGLSGKIAGVRNPEKLKSMAHGKLPGKGFLQGFLSVDRLGIGLIAPTYSEFTLQAASVKGLDIGVSKTGWYYDVSLGRMSKQFTGPFSSVKPEYDRNLAIARLGLGDRHKAHLAMEYMRAFDTKLTDSLSPMVNNGVLNIDFRTVFLKSLTLEGDLAQSSYKESYNSLNIQSVQPTSHQVFNPNASRAYRLKAIQQAGKNTSLQIEARQVGAAFKSMGNPFLRRNFREVDAKVEHKFWKQRIQLQASYKEMRDNLLELNPATNRLKGWGIKLQTSFEKLPNITFSHNPYQQGNNHPDSLYRTNNQYSITMMMLTYKKRFKGLNWSSMACMTRSAMEISGRGPVAYRMLNISNMFQVGMRHSVLTNYLSNTTLPGVDSLNSSSYQFNYAYLAKKGLSIGSIGEYTIYKNAAFKAGGGLTAGANLIRNLSLSVLVRYDRINGLWRLKDQDVWTGRVVVNWRW